MSDANPDVTPSSGNIFADLGLPDADARLATVRRQLRTLAWSTYSLVERQEIARACYCFGWRDADDNPPDARKCALRATARNARSQTITSDNAQAHLSPATVTLLKAQRTN